MTKHPDPHDLIQADIDGVASEADRARLRDLLANDPEARDEHRRLRSLRDLLAAVPPEAPPAQLAARVMHRVRAERAGSHGGIVRRFLSSWPGGRVAIPYAYAAAAGAAIGILGFHVLTGGGSLGPDALEREATATIGSAPLGVETSRLALTSGTITGSATLRRLDGSLALDVDLPAEGSLDVSIDFDPASVKFIGISNRTGGVDHIEIADGTVRWSQSQPQRVTVFLVPRSEAASQLRVGLSGDGGTSGGRTIDLPGRN
jgi:hypothetical protein